MPARSRGSGLTEGLQLPVVDGVRQRGGEFEVALLHAAAWSSCISMPYSTPLGSRCCRRIRSRSEPGGPSFGNASTRSPDADHARPGELAGQALPQMLAERDHVLAPARRQERIADPTACGTPDGCRNRRSASFVAAVGVREPECSSHSLLACSPHYRRFAASSRKRG